ncbi:MAG: sigma-70 family RNA polymerase sigma factor [Planctomycetes bacterium]|nr:sigma-70 family RNA polymerase sigma factor [Planctomycetota bacterium]
MLDEEGFRRLLDRYHASKDEDERERIGNEILSAILDHWDHELRPLLAREFSATKSDTSVRYSAMVSAFFADILEENPDVLWRADSLRALTRYASVVISRDILDVLRRKKTRKDHADPLRRFVESRAAHFESRHQLDLECALGELAAWDRRAAPWPLRARVIRFRYLDAMEYEEIAAQEGLPIKVIYRAKADAIEELRRTCGDDAKDAGNRGAR